MGRAMVTGARVVVRRCPECGGVLDGRPGLEWLACGRCPFALDPFSAPPRRIPTFRPDGAVEHGGPMLPFYVFRLGRVGSARIPSEPIGPAWVHGFRVVRLQIHGDAGARLTAKRHDPRLVPAALGCSVARGPGAALRILRARLGLAQRDPLEVLSVQLAALPCRLEGTLLREPVSGVVYPLSLILPRPPAGGLYSGRSGN